MRMNRVLVGIFLSTFFAHFGSSQVSPNEFWAVLVAGSKGIVNYRHQADLCHTYHLLTKQFQADPAHVIVMMFDDVAWSLNNPLLGRLYNEPDGDDVYDGCRIDYSGENVTVDNFLQVLENTAIDTGGAPKSLFISYVDHGHPGGLLFPSGETLTAHQLLNTFNRIHHRFRHVLMYVEACNGGSVFEPTQHKFPPGVVAMSASNSTESSWGTYCPTIKHPCADRVNGVHIGTCLADLFEVSWKRDLENRLNEPGGMSVSLGEHMNAVRNRVSKSTVMVYGDESLLANRLDEFFPVAERMHEKKQISKCMGDEILFESAIEHRQWPDSPLPALPTCELADTSFIMA